MRRYPIIILLFIALVFALVAGGCGSEDKSASKLSPLGLAANEQNDQPGRSSDDADVTPSEILAMVTANTELPATETGDFELTIKLDVDTSGMDEQTAAFVADPWTIAGSVAFDTAKQAADVTLDLTLMQQTISVGIKALDQKAWIGLGDHWFEAPGDLMAELGSGDTAGMDELMAQLQQLMTNVSLDPVSWLKDQADVKIETIDGAKVYHISGSDPDWAKIVADLVKITEDPTFTSLLGEAESLGDVTGGTLPTDMPTEEELQQVQSVLEDMIQEFKIDLWVQQDNSRLRKAAVSAKIVPPSEDDMAGLDTEGLGEMDLAGLNSIEISGTINLNPNQAVNVVAPDSALPLEEIQNVIMENPELLGPFGMLLTGMTGGFDTY